MSIWQIVIIALVVVFLLKFNGLERLLSVFRAGKEGVDEFKKTSSGENEVEIDAKVVEPDKVVEPGKDE